MTTDERLLSLERSVSFHKKTTLAVLLLCVCLLTTGLAANQEAEDITVKSIKFIGTNGKVAAIMKADKSNNTLVMRNPKSTEAQIGFLLAEDTSGVVVIGPSGMTTANIAGEDVANIFISDKKRDLVRASIYASRPGNNKKITAHMLISDRYGDKVWSEGAR